MGGCPNFCEVIFFNRYQGVPGMVDFLIVKILLEAENLLEIWKSYKFCEERSVQGLLSLVVKKQLQTTPKPKYQLQRHCQYHGKNKQGIGMNFPMSTGSAHLNSTTHLVSVESV